MNNRAVTLSLVMAGFAVFFVYSYVSSIEEKAQREFGSKVWVLKARKDIGESEDLNDSMVVPAVIPKRFLEPSAVYVDPTDAQGANDLESMQRAANQKIKDLIGMVAVVPIRQGEQITLTKIRDAGIRTGLSPQVAPGRRAVAVPVNEITGVAKLVKPGDRVDVIAVIDTGAGKQNRIVKTVLQDVVVLAVGRNVTGNPGRLKERDPISGKERIRPLSEDSSFASVTLEVEPAQAQVLALLASNGDNSLNLALRNNDDQERAPAGTTMMTDVLGGDKARLPAGVGERR